MQRLGAVYRQANQKPVFFEENGPRIVDFGAVCLDRIGDLLARPAIGIDQLHRATEEIEPHQSRFPALPGDRHLRGAVGVQQLPDVGL